MFVKVFISLFFLTTSQAYAGPFDDLQKGLGGLKELEGMLNQKSEDKKSEDKDEKIPEEAIKPEVEDPEVARMRAEEAEAKRKEAEAKKKEEERRKEEKRVAREKAQKKAQEEELARQAQEFARRELLDSLLFLPVADRCKEEYLISNEEKEIVKKYFKKDIQGQINEGVASKEWVNGQLKKVRFQVYNLNLVDLVPMCQVQESMAVSMKIEESGDEDAFD
jgi:flagellar biosynthesis GTPase FlhF